MSDHGLRQVLARHGYRVKFREHEWVDCLIASAHEAFEGRGLDRKAALEAALSRAFPSRIARELLEVAAAAAERPPVVSSEIASPEFSDDGPTMSLAVEENHIPLPVVVHVPPESRGSEEGRNGTLRALDRSNGGRVPPAPPSRGVPLLVRTRDALPPPSSQRSLEELAILTERIEASRSELAWSTAPRQRLAILAWICEARSHTDVYPDHAEIREAVAKVSRQLTDIGKAFWPGSVTALQLQMQPSDLPRHLLGGSPTTWARAAELAERALASLEHADERRGQDAYGWADADALSPEPTDPQVILDGLVGTVEAAWGPLDRYAEPLNPEDLPDPVQYLHWVRELRWIRLQNVDPDLWARVTGRLRWWACRRNGPVQAEGRELEPTFRPEHPWSSLLHREGRKRSNGTLPADLVAAARGRYAGKRLLCVGHRRDPEEQAQLTSALPDTEFEWRLLEPSLLESVPRELEAGGFHAVMSALGLQAQSADLALARGCRAVAVPYLRANRGQPVACLRALAKAS